MRELSAAFLARSRESEASDEPGEFLLLAALPSEVRPANGSLRGVICDISSLGLSF